MTTIPAGHIRPSVGPMLELLAYDQICNCPRCRRAVRREHVVVEDLRVNGSCISLVYCEFCERGFETLWRALYSNWQLDFTVVHDGRKLDEFRQRIEEQICVTA